MLLHSVRSGQETWEACPAKQRVRTPPRLWGRRAAAAKAELISPESCSKRAELFAFVGLGFIQISKEQFRLPPYGERKI